MSKPPKLSSHHAADTHEPARHVSPSHALSSLLHARQEKLSSLRHQEKELEDWKLAGTRHGPRNLLRGSLPPSVAAARLRRKSLDSHMDEAKARPWRLSLPGTLAREHTVDYDSLPELLRPKNGLPPKQQQPACAPARGAASVASEKRGFDAEASESREHLETTTVFLTELRECSVMKQRESAAMNMLRSMSTHGVMASLRMREEVREREEDGMTALGRPPPKYRERRASQDISSGGGISSEFGRTRSEGGGGATHPISLRAAGVGRRDAAAPLERQPAAAAARRAQPRATATATSRARAPTWWGAQPAVSLPYRIEQRPC